MVYRPIGDCCEDCMEVIVYGTGREESVIAVRRLNASLVIGEEQGFSWRRCDVCGADYGGTRHAVGYLDTER